jgi:type II secretory pathway component PulF
MNTGEDGLFEIRGNVMAMVNAFRQIQVTQAQGKRIDEELSVKEDELLTFTESCRDLYEAGVPINEILRQLQQAVPNQKLALALNFMVNDIENGKFLSEAMARFPNIFGEDYLSMIQAAEKSGKWTRKRDKYGQTRDGILEMLIKYIKRRSGAREKVRSGLLYPAFIMAAIIAALGAFAFYVLPALRQLFAVTSPDAELGLLTSLLFKAGDLIENYWWAMPFAAAGIGFMAWYFWKFGGGRALWMKYQLKIKVVGPVFAKMNLGEMMWLMGMLFSAGLTPQEVLTIVIGSTRNTEIASALVKAKEDLFNGISFCDALKRAHWLFEGQAYMVLSSAQKNGQLGTALQNYAEQLFEKVDQGIDRLVKLIEPIIIVIAGVMVGLLLVAYYGGLGAAVRNLAVN